MSDNHQALMDQAYDRWQASSPQWSKQQFWDHLDAKERIAVFIGNMNCQVCNGGWMQWMSNGYATEETVGFIFRKMEEVNTPEAQTVMGHLENITEIAAQVGWDLNHGSDEEWEEINATLDPMCTEYYAINEALMQQVEEKFFA